MLSKKLIELQVNSAAHTMFQAMTLLQFWTKQLVAYSNLANSGVRRKFSRGVVIIVKVSS